jgi:hypothetical protein
MPPIPQDERTASETTGLLKKAYGSAGSLARSYENVRDSMELQLMQNTIADIDQRINTKITNNKYNVFQRKNALCILLTALALTTAFLTASFLPPSWWKTNEKNETNVDDDNDNNNMVPPAWDFEFPFSHLDPVHDLGLAEHKREPAVSPDWHFLRASLKSEGDDRNALPTNSWYQNLLMVRDEPSNLQRVYPVPYLVDVVGLIPGIRAHVTHVEANAEVMQLSFNDNFGLVVGATAIFNATAASIGVIDEDDDTFGSHKYKVAATTDLGITLEWVRATVLLQFCPRC